MMIAASVEAEGEKNFHVNFDTPSAECQVERFNAGGMTVVAYAVPELKGKGVNALLYKFVVSRPEGDSTILVIRGITALLLPGRSSSMHVSEERNGVISWYAMYREIPSYAAVRAVAERVAKGSMEPLLSVRWPPGAREPEIVLVGKHLK